MWKEKIISSFDGTKIAVQWTEPRDYTCVLVNGLGGRISAFSRLIESFQEKIQFLSWDYRALFCSSVPSNLHALTISDHVRDCQQLLSEFKVKRALFAGWSLGVQIAIEGYRLFPEAYQGLLLFNGLEGEPIRSFSRLPFLEKGARSLIIKLSHHTEYLKEGVMRALEWIALPYLLPYFSIVRKNQDVFLALMKDYLNLDITHFFQLLLYANEHSASDLLSRISVPVLVIAGDRDLLSPKRKVLKMAQSMPQAQVVVFKNSSHYTLLEYPEKVIPLVRQFLQKQLHFKI